MPFLKAQWELFALKAPVFSWIVSALLLTYFVYIFLKNLWKSRTRFRIFSEAGKKLRSLQVKDTVRPGVGLSAQEYDGIGDIFHTIPLLRDLWQSISSHIIRRTDKDGEDRFWIAEDIGTISSGANIVDSHDYKTAPTIITAVGLLATFLAILVALLDVRLINNRVQGLDLLIQGLSGKFMSSVIALFCAALLLFFERWVFQSAYAGIASLSKTLNGLIPKLTSAQILSDLHKDIAEQSNAFKIFNTDLSFKLKQSFGESVGPTLERMVTAVDDLNQFLRAAEAQKHESMTEQLATLLRNLERSIESSLGRMGAQFNSSLTGSTQEQFGKVTESLSSTAILLQQMNAQFALNQNVLNDLIHLAKNTTADQMASGQAQVQELTGVLRELMVQLQEKTGESMDSITKTLAAITLDLSNKVTDLSVQMGSIIEDSSERTSKTAKEILDQAGTFSSRSAEQLTKLLEHHSSELTKVEDLRTLLDGTLKEFNASVNRYGQITSDLKKLSSEVSIAVTSMSQSVKLIKDSQEAAARVSVSASGQIESLKTFTQNQKEVWERIQGSMLQYENVFKRVESHAKDLLTEILNNLGDYSSTTQEHFNKLGTIANNHISEATNRIAGSIDELGEQLDELHTVVANIVSATRTSVR